MATGKSRLSNDGRSVLKNSTLLIGMAQTFLSDRAKDGMSPKTRREELRVLKKFLK